MSLLVFVVVVAMLVMWAIYYIPFPRGAPSWAKNVAYVMVVLVAVIVILSHVGLLAAAR